MTAQTNIIKDTFSVLAAVALAVSMSVLGMHVMSQCMLLLN